MTGHTVARAHWTALDREGEDKCRLAQEDEGWLLVGHARFRDAGGFAALDYVIRCDSGWHTLTADVAGMHGDEDIQLHITRDGDAWQVNGQDQPDLEDACDVDLGFTPATNLMPLRRLRESEASKLTLRAAWLDYPAKALSPLDQTYLTGTGPALVQYHAAQTGTETLLAVDFSGFVTLYPRYWQGEVEHAPR